MKLKSLKYDYLIVIILGIISIGISAYPILTDTNALTLDGTFHLARIQSLADALKEGVFPVKVHPSLLYTYGYGVGFFYPDLFLYLPAFLMYLGVSLGTAYHVYILFMLLVAFAIGTAAVSCVSGNCLAGGIAGVFLVSSPFYLCEVYDGSIGTFAAMGFFLAAISGYICLIEEKKGGEVLFCIGLIGVLQAHSITFVILMITGVLLLIFSVNDLIRAPRVLLRIIGCGGISALLSANYLLPAFEQVLHQKFRGQTELQTVPLYEKTLTLAELVERLGSTTILVFVIAVIGTLWLAGHGENMKWQIRIAGLILVLSFLTCHPTFWKMTYSFLGFFQYPVRLLNAVDVLIAFLSGLTFTVLLDRKNVQACGTAIRIIVFAFVGMAMILFPRKQVDSDLIAEKPHSMEIAQEVYDDAVMNTGREWLPVENHTIPADDRAVARADDGSGAEGVKHQNGKWFEVWVEMEKSYYLVPYVYYYGYHAYLLNDTTGAITQELIVDKGDNGLVRIHLPEEGNGIGHVHVVYRKTPVQKVAYLISIVMLLGVVTYSIRRNML